jgi:hypothetical protein
MEFKELNPSQVITTRDFPVYSAEVLEKYFEIYRNGNGNDLPPVPLMDSDFVIPHLEEPDRILLEEFLRKNPEVRYFLLNGSHRTTSANLTRHSIVGVLIRTEEDIQQTSQIEFKGKKYEHYLPETVLGNIKDLVNNFRGTDRFETIQQKTDRMVDETVIAEHMIRHYRNSPK